MITATFSDEDAERIGFLANDLASRAGLSFDDSQAIVVRAWESYSERQG